MFRRYLNAHGDFMVVYSDNTTAAKVRTWNGSTWGAQVAVPAQTSIPTFIVARARPGTNEVMAAFFNQALDTYTAYFNGGTYSAGNWTLHPQHAGNAPATTKQLVDFAWSPNDNLVGALVYTTASNAKAVTVRIWTANASGSGAWSTARATTNQSSNIGSVSVVGRPGCHVFYFRFIFWF
jgi:hypothetical protein